MNSEPSAAFENSYFLDLRVLQAGDAVLWEHDSDLGPGWRAYRSPLAILQTHSLQQVKSILAQVEAMRAKHTLVGFVSYDASPAFDEALRVPGESTGPLVWFAAYSGSGTFHRELVPTATGEAELATCDEWDYSEYSERFAQVKWAIEHGETYQINLTFRKTARVEDPRAFFTARCGTTPPRYAAYIAGEGWEIASFSPELFFRQAGDLVSMEPMKGTATVGSSAEETERVAQHLRSDPKSVAENIMIVDMIRNDLGRIAETGSVHVPALLQVERHRGLLQMTSRVEAKTNVGMGELFGAMFPPASVTGAPKVKSCEFIAQLESSSRGVYCGAIGVVSAATSRFAVAIRTAWFDHATSQGTFGVGSGLVWDSDPAAEFAECQSKAELLHRDGKRWALIETIPAHHLRDSHRVQRHLDRLLRTATQLGIRVDQGSLKGLVAEQLPATPEERIKIRIEVSSSGDVSITRVPSVVTQNRLRAAISSRRVNSRDPNLQLKTTSREILDLARAESPELDEVLLLNEQDEATEFSYGNLVIDLDGVLMSPYPECGALPGVEVARRVEFGQIQYATIKREDLRAARHVFFVNSVVGMLPVDLDLAGASQ